MMRIKNCWWIKFLFREGHGLFIKLSLECPVCHKLNAVDTTGLEIGEGRGLLGAAQESVQEIRSAEYQCEGCGVSSIVAPKAHLEEELKSLAEELTMGFFEKLPMVQAPAKTRAICIN